MPFFKKRVLPSVHKIVAGTEIWRSNSRVSTFLGNGRLQAKLQKRFGLHLELSQERFSKDDSFESMIREGEHFAQSKFPEKIIEIKSLNEINFLNSEAVGILSTVFNVKFRLPNNAVVESHEISDTGFWILRFPDGTKETFRR